MVARAWEWLRRKKPLVDAFFALPVVAFTLPSLLGGTSGLGPVRYLLLSAGLIAPLVLRRTFPRAVFVAVVLVSGVQCLLGVIPVPANLAVLMVLYTITANYTFRWGVAAVLVVEAGSVMATVRYPSGAQDRRFTFIMLTVMVAGVYILGLHMRTRRAYLRSVEERAARLELERDNEVRMAMAAERARIARELHDVVAHNVSVIVVQADGAAYAIDTDVDGPGRRSTRSPRRGGWRWRRCGGSSASCARPTTPGRSRRSRGSRSWTTWSSRSGRPG